MSGRRVPGLWEGLKQAERLGFTVEHIRKTGEVKVYLPGQPMMKVNVRRKDAPRELLRRIEKRQKQNDQ